MEGTSGKTAAFKEIVKTMNTIKSDAATNPQQAQSQLNAADNSSQPFERTQQEEARLLSEMRKLSETRRLPNVICASDFWLLACLRARKGDVTRALALASSYLDWREKVDYEAHLPTKSPIVRQILSAGIFVPADNVSRDGRPVLTVRYRCFDPRRFSALDTARAFGFVVEWMLRTYPKVQTHGMVVVEDTAGFSLKNFDIRLVSFLEKAFSSILPIRISAMHIINPNFIIRAMFTLFSSFFSDKLKARIRLFGKGDEEKFAQFFQPNQNLSFLNMGGTKEWTPAQQESVTSRMVRESQGWAQATRLGE